MQIQSRDWRATPGKELLLPSEWALLCRSSPATANSAHSVAAVVGSGEEILANRESGLMCASRVGYMPKYAPDQWCQHCVLLEGFQTPTSAEHLGLSAHPCMSQTVRFRPKRHTTGYRLLSAGMHLKSRIIYLCMHVTVEALAIRTVSNFDPKRSRGINSIAVFNPLSMLSLRKHVYM